MDIEKKIEIAVDTRSMRLPTGFVLGAYNDKDSHRVCFTMDRYFNGIDLSEYTIYVMSMNAFGDDDQFMVTEIEVTEDKIEFIWVVQKLMFIVTGDVTFSVCFRKVDEEAHIISEYNTSVAIAEVVKDIVAAGGVIEDVEKDIVIQIINYRNEARQAALAAQEAQHASEEARDESETARDASIDNARKSQSYATGDAVDNNGDPYREGQATDNSKWYSQESNRFMNETRDMYRISQSYAVGGALDDNDDPVREGQDTDNSKYYKEQAGISNDFAYLHEQMSKSYAIGQGVDANNDPIREHQSTDNAKVYKEQANESQLAALYNQRMSESYAVGGTIDDEGNAFREGQDTDNSKYYAQRAGVQADRSHDEALNSEAWAKGTKDDEPVEDTDPTYQNNAKYYSELASANGEEKVLDAEAWAKGTHNNEPVDNEDPTYHNNAKYYSELASANGEAKVRDAEAWANGTRNGEPIDSEDPAYQKNSKHWSDEAAHKVSLVSTEWGGTWEEWDALTAEEQAEYDFVDITDDWEEVGEFVGATETTHGTRGLVPAPHAGIRTRGLRADGSWGLVESNVFIGTQDRWDALSSADKLEYKMALIVDLNELIELGGEEP